MTEGCILSLAPLQEIQRQKTLQREQEKLEEVRVMEFLKEKEVCGGRRWEGCGVP